MRCRNARLATGSRESPKASLHHTPKVEPDAVDRNTLRAGSTPAGAGLTMAGLRGKPLIAYLVVCVFWGSTYLAIRVGVSVLPPFLFAGLRFLVAGVLLLGIALALGDRLPRRAVDWRTSAIVGLFLLSGGNAFVVWAEQFTASGIASIFVVTVALWMAFFDAIIPGGSGDLSWRVVAGLLVGFALGEWSAWHLTPRGLGAIAYLVVFGSILGYSAYTYALRHASPTIVGT